MGVAVALLDGDPESIAAYRLLDRLGAGGMGTVYLAQAESGRLVAVKVVHPQIADDREFRLRFRLEVAAARRVSGAFTTPVVDADPDADRPWMATVFTPGVSLRQRVQQDGPLSPTELRQLAVGLVEALRDLHRAGVVHRDLKPDNVLLTDDGPRVIDFGISRVTDQQTLTVTGRILGTPPYMSPEQLSSARKVTPASDIFALGSVIVFAALGHGPFDADNHYLTAYNVVHDPPKIAALSGTVREIVQWCLAKEPHERPTPADLFAAFDRVPACDWGPRPDTLEPSRHRLIAASRPPARWSLAMPRPRLVLAGAVCAVVLAALPWAIPQFSGNPQAGPKDIHPTTLGPSWPPKLQLEPTAAQQPKGWGIWETKIASTRALSSSGQQGIDHCVASHLALLCGNRGGAPGLVSGYNAATGRPLWEPRYEPGESTEAVGIDEVTGLGYYATNESGVITAIDMITGKKRFTLSYGYDGSAPVYLPQAIVVISHGKGITAWDPASGKRLWNRPYPTGDAISSLLESRGALYARSEGDKTQIARINPRTGDLLWQLPLSGFKLLAAGDDTLLLQPVDSTGESSGGQAIVLDAKTHKRKTAHAPPGPASYAYDGERFLGLEPNGTVTSIDSATGTQQWSTETRTDSRTDTGGSSRILVAGDRAYFMTTSSRILCLDRRQGNVLWQSASRSDGSHPPSALSPTPTNDRIYGVSQRGTIFAIKPPTM